ncbi:hypothetical protein FACS1894208_00160 [Clostridia bacterium]|nr:hypothetical protein FACS1894208_00160 [Clostridia bacterium]
MDEYGYGFGTGDGGEYGNQYGNAGYNGYDGYAGYSEQMPGGFGSGYDTPAPGIYTPNGIDYSSPPDFDCRRLTGLGFSTREIYECKRLFNNNVKFSMAILQQMYDYETAARLKYLYDIAQGKHEINTDDELCRHLKKLHGNKRRVTIADIPPSLITEVPKLCVIGNVTDKLFGIYNSGLYPLDSRFYRVIQATSAKTVIRTSRRPEIKFRGATTVEGVASILSQNADGTIDVQFNPEYTRLCSRFIVLVSVKFPEFHLGCYETIAVDGSRVYTFGRILPAKWDLKYKAAQERVLSGGVLPKEINAKIADGAKKVHKLLSGVKTRYIAPTMVYELLHNPAAEYGESDNADSRESVSFEMPDV